MESSMKSTMEASMETSTIAAMESAIAVMAIIPGVIRIGPESPASAVEEPGIVPVGRVVIIGVAVIAAIIKGWCVMAHDIARWATRTGLLAAGAADRGAARGAGHATDHGPRCMIAATGHARSDHRTQQAADHGARPGIAVRLDTVLLCPLLGISLIALVLLLLLLRHIALVRLVARRRRRWLRTVITRRWRNIVARLRPTLIAGRRPTLIAGR